MTVTLFMFLFVILTIASGVVTEVIKKIATKMPTNIIALIDSLIVGGAGSIIAYILLGVAFTASSIVCIPLLVGCIFAGSIVGYDKIKQTIEQILEFKAKKD